MSFFYLAPVKGDMPVHLLETVINKRLEYLQGLLKGNTAVYNEFIIEGSLYDNVGHFMLCIIAILGQNTEFSQFLHKSEVALFIQRFSALSTYDLRRFAHKLLRNIRKYEKTPSFIDPLSTLCQHLTIRNLAQHTCSSSHKDLCSDFNIKVNFKHCLNLVAKRQVELSNGIALIPCGKWKHYMATLFSYNLKYRLQYTDLSPLKSDPRIMELFHKIKQKYFISNKNNTDCLLSSNVDNESKHFPPCMLNLHRNLRNRHRLSHNQRFYYSLFLKDIGMPIEEAITFWQSEYRQNPNGSHSCCHNWERDEKKYLYGIRHMYGLEGGRKSYASVNCQRIQSLDNACTEGGCPFKSFDNLKTMNLINSSAETWSQIMELKKQYKYTDCCIMYLKSFGNNVCDNFSFNFTPVKYYNIVSKSSKTMDC